MDITFEGWTRRRMLVTPADDQSGPIYEVEYKQLKNKLIFTTNGKEVATSKMHSSTTNFGVELNGLFLEVNSDKFWKFQRSYHSPAFGQKITWKRSTTFTKLDLVCLDANDMPIAKFATKSGWKKVGRLEIDDTQSLNREQKEELLVVGLTLAYQVIQNMVAGASSADYAAAAATIFVAAA